MESVDAPVPQRAAASKGTDRVQKVKADSRGSEGGRYQDGGVAIGRAGKSSPTLCLEFLIDTQVLSSDRASSKDDLSRWLYRAGLMDGPTPVGTQLQDVLALGGGHRRPWGST